MPQTCAELRRAAHREWDQPKRSGEGREGAVLQAAQLEGQSHRSTLALGMNSRICYVSCFGQAFLHYPHYLTFGTVLHPLCPYMLVIYFFNFTRGTVRKLPGVSEETLEY